MWLNFIIQARWPEGGRYRSFESWGPSVWCYMEEAMGWVLVHRFASRFEDALASLLCCSLFISWSLPLIRLSL